VGKRSSFGPYFDNPNLTVAYTSYSGCAGTWYPEALDYGDCWVAYPTSLSASPRFVAISSNMNGIFRYCAAISIAAVSDGTNNTLLYSEKANGALATRDPANGNANDSACYDWWADAVAGDTLFTTLYPINAFRFLKLFKDERNVSWTEGVSSYHPGGGAIRAGRRLGPVHQGDNQLLADCTHGAVSAGSDQLQRRLRPGPGNPAGRLPEALHVRHGRIDRVGPVLSAPRNGCLPLASLALVRCLAVASAWRIRWHGTSRLR
jgi:hypothetical protein